MPRAWSLVLHVLQRYGSSTAAAVDSSTYTPYGRKQQQHLETAVIESTAISTRTTAMRVNKASATRLEFVEKYTHCPGKNSFEVAKFSLSLSPRHGIRSNPLPQPVFMVLAAVPVLRYPLRAEQELCCNMVLPKSFNGQVFCVRCSDSPWGVDGGAMRKVFSGMRN